MKMDRQKSKPLSPVRYRNLLSEEQSLNWGAQTELLLWAVNEHDESWRRTHENHRCDTWEEVGPVWSCKHLRQSRIRNKMLRELRADTLSASPFQPPKKELGKFGQAAKFARRDK